MPKYLQKYECKEKIKKDINVKCKSAPGVELSLIAELLFYKVPAHLITINCTQESKIETHKCCRVQC